MKASTEQIRAGRGKGNGPPTEKLLFDAACVFASEAERERFLDYACRGDLEMRDRVRALLGVRTDADDFFEFEPQVEVEPDDSGPEDGLGVGIGRYRLVERLGAGGCGVVYLAEQLEPVRRKVALKIIRLGVDGPEIAARFVAESQSLASMNHPNIARVLDAGSTPNGRPFFVMELVDGEAITDYCDSRRLDIRERLKLFVRVCRAIQHAHQRGVVHRDIKPSNVLVESHEAIAVPKVIDFGIAADRGALDENGGDSFMGTPAYMSPELASGEGTVDTQCDVFSLGVLLAELLSGPPRHVPKDVLSHGVEEARRRLRSSRPELPSSVLRSLRDDERGKILADRAVSEKQLAAWCEAELDWIVKRAVEPDPSDRYATVNGLALDVSRWLDGEPVAARPWTRSYLFARLVRRNRMLFAGGAIALVGLVLGLGVSTWLFLSEREAREEQARLRSIAEDAGNAEAKLRRKAEAGETVAHAAVLLRDGDIDGADRMLAQVAQADVPASLEAVTTFRKAGEWLMEKGRWEEASNRFAAVARAIATVDKREVDAVSIHFVAAAAAACDSGNFELYEELRQLAVERFAETNDPFVSDEIVKACLVTPAKPEFLKQLDPLLRVMEGHLGWDRVDAPHELMEAWQMLSLSMAAYRNGDDPQTEKWARRCVSHPNENGSRVAAARSILAMALHRLGRPEEARDLFREARGQILLHFDQPFDTAWTADGYWFDWMIARVLLREAEVTLRQ